MYTQACTLCTQYKKNVMIEVTNREFRNNWKRYKDLLKDGEVISVGGFPLIGFNEGALSGIKTNYDNIVQSDPVIDPKKKYGTSVEELRKKVRDIEGGIGKEVSAKAVLDEQMEEVILEKCDKCKHKYPQVFDYEEEGMEYKICGYCYKKVFKKFPKGFEV